MPASTSVARDVSMARDSDKHANRNAILLLLAVFLVAGYVVEWGPQTLVWLEAKQWASVNPWLLEVPEPLPAPLSPPSKGTDVKAYNYEFTAPWPIATITPSLTYVLVRFRPGQAVVFFDPEAQLDTLRVLKNSKPLEYQKFVNMFSEHPIETNYALYESVYGASPAQLSPFTPVRTALRLNTLLQWKLSFGTEGGAGAHSLVFGDNRGFQFGDPDTGKPVAVRIFNDRDKQFRFLFNVSAGSDAKITQADIDAMIATLRPVPILER
jgi:hypothetical protein